MASRKKQKAELSPPRRRRRKKDTSEGIQNQAVQPEVNVEVSPSPGFIALYDKVAEWAAEMGVSVPEAVEIWGRVVNRNYPYVDRDGRLGINVLYLM